VALIPLAADGLSLPIRDLLEKLYDGIELLSSEIAEEGNSL
jgi:hypothetical protein